MSPEPLDRLDLDPGLLPKFPLEARDRFLPLLEEAARDVPAASVRLELAARQQHLALALEDALDGRRRVGPVSRAAGGALGVATVSRGELVAAARAEPPSVEDAHALPTNHGPMAAPAAGSNGTARPST